MVTGAALFSAHSEPCVPLDLLVQLWLLSPVPFGAEFSSCGTSVWGDAMRSCHQELGAGGTWKIPVLKAAVSSTWQQISGTTTRPILNEVVQ